MPEQPTFNTNRTYIERIDALAVYCSDGRFTSHCDQLLGEHLNAPNHDRVVIPGGPGALVGHEAAAIDPHGLLEDLSFLITAHELDHVVLIAHAGCAFYAKRLGIPAESRETQQRRDLEHARHLIADHAAPARIDLYLARPNEQNVSFDAI